VKYEIDGIYTVVGQYNSTIYCSEMRSAVELYNHMPF
jgi:hypothetical protein